ncbi:MAG: hypothetical protein IR164_16530 [Devosia sp.]|uniref:hypothetical protein n=1 Tax=Devosia sp. TaxID=1871048 RepID=UPI0019DD3D6A|nr:hypothetical protein [Devosia sp.]MBF0680532.1 hypothetical protein [Devosia sp.]
MPWEIVAIWAIVIVTLTWFRRDEERLRSHRLAEQARYFATASRYRHRPETPKQTAEPIPAQALVHRHYLDLLKSGAAMAPQAPRT